MSIKQNILRGLALSVALVTIGAASASSAADQDRRVVVINETQHTITNIYASASSDPNYHGDILGNNSIAPGQKMTVDFADGGSTCAMDVKAVFNDGDKVETHSFDVCTRPEMRFTGN